MIEAAQFAIYRAGQVLALAFKVLFFMAVLWSVTPILGSLIHSKFFPVMVSSETNLYLSDPINKNITQVSGTALRRQDCDFVELRWYHGLRGERRSKVHISAQDRMVLSQQIISLLDKGQALVVFLEKSKVRPRGEMVFGPWNVRLGISQLWHSHADVVHENCRYRLFGAEIVLPWQVTSHFFDGNR